MPTDVTTRAVPLVTKNKAGEFFVTLPADDYVAMGMAAASWHLDMAARAIDRALSAQLPPGARASWRRGTWA